MVRASVEKTGTLCGTSFLVNSEGILAASGAGASGVESPALDFGLATVSLPEVGGPWAQTSDATQKTARTRQAFIKHTISPLTQPGWQGLHGALVDVAIGALLAQIDLEFFLGAGEFPVAVGALDGAGEIEAWGAASTGRA